MALVFPFLAAIVLFLTSPLLVWRVKRRVATWLAESRRYADIDPKGIPDYLAPEQIGVYIEYATDVVQVVPAFTLTGVGVVLALPGSMSPVATAALVLGVVLLIVIVDAVLLEMSPHRYLRRKILGVSPVATLGIVVNIVGVLVVAVAR